MCANYFCTQKHKKPLYSYSHNGFTIPSVIDERREMNDGTFPVKICVIFKREQKYYSTGKNLSIEEWKRLPDTKSRKQIAVRTDIQYSFDKVKNAVLQLERDAELSVPL